MKKKKNVIEKFDTLKEEVATYYDDERLRSRELPNQMIYRQNLLKNTDTGHAPNFNKTTQEIDLI